uniref:Putative ovule protein n=1 Tax=Solanum chacoense TaxID=4108 RepID=A0A0V0GXE3_SOLCH
MLGCLETRVKQLKSQRILNKVGNGWNSKCNYPEAVNGRIWLLWRSKAQVQLWKQMKYLFIAMWRTNMDLSKPMSQLSMPRIQLLKEFRCGLH